LTAWYMYLYFLLYLIIIIVFIFLEMSSIVRFELADTLCFYYLDNTCTCII